jgi:beta-galactosidase
MTQPLLGVDYYPEHWPESRWRIDARLMRDAGLTVVRLAEFAWTQLEPEEGEYAWGWLDSAVETIAAEGLEIVLCTPTATPPAWLIQQHPDILPVDAQGHRRHFGSRRHYCSNNIVYHRYSQQIVTDLSTRYQKHPAIIGWQIDNEFGCHDTARCYCERCVTAFRDWLQRKYGSLAALNSAWGTAFWSQSYTDWNQIPSPNLTPTLPNPSQTLDWYRFSSDSVAAFSKIQIDILRRVCPKHFITTNFMGTFPDLNHYDMAEPLDFISWDSYPTGFAEMAAPTLYLPHETRPKVAYDVGDPYMTSFCHDLMRGLKPNKPFWIMEQQAGHINWGHTNPAIRPGTIRLWTWHDMAAGADTVVYFRWRACRFAQEQYHSGLLRHDAAPDIGLQDVLRMKGEQSLMRNLQNAKVQADVAILVAYDDLWATDLQPHNQLCTYWRHLFGYYRSLVRAGVPVDILSNEADLRPYKLVVAPNQMLADRSIADRLQSYVQQGGILLMGGRSGFKTPTNLVTDQPLPGVFHDLVGATVEAFHSLPDGVGYPLTSPQLSPMQATNWAEGISLQSAQAIASYSDGPLKGLAAVTDRQVGLGRVIYAGIWPSESVAAQLLGLVLPLAKVQPLAEMPEGVCVYRRGSYILLLNFTEAACSVLVHEGNLMDAFTDKKLNQKFEIPARDVRVIKMNVGS